MSDGELRLTTDEYGGQSVWFWCDGCDTHHSYQIKNADPAKVPDTVADRWRKMYTQGPLWTFNGDLKKPTFKPSLLCNGSTPVEEVRKRGAHRCHIFVTDGMVQYLSDCTHHLAGKTERTKLRHGAT